MKIIIIFFYVLLLSACATSYQRVGFSGGFDELQLDDNMWRVTFRGNGYTSRQRTSDFALLRCAELTLKKGFKYFVLVTGNTSTSTSAHTTPTQSFVSGNTITTTGGSTYLISKPSTSNTILMLKEKPKTFVYNAKFIVKSIRAAYDIEPEVKPRTKAKSEKDG